MFFSLLVLSIIGASLALPAGEMAAADTQRYHVFGRANWFMAEEVCASNGMSLVKINDQSTSDAVTYFIEKVAAVSGPYWTLATKLNDDTTWSFGAGEPVKFFNWAAGEPNNVGNNEMCIEIYKNGQWNDQNCSNERFVLCEKL